MIKMFCVRRLQFGSILVNARSRFPAGRTSQASSAMPEGGHFESTGGSDVTIYGIKDYVNYDTCIYDEIPQMATWDNSKVGGTAGDDDVTVRYGNNDINVGAFP